MKNRPFQRLFLLLALLASFGTRAAAREAASAPVRHSAGVSLVELKTLQPESFENLKDVEIGNQSPLKI